MTCSNGAGWRPRARGTLRDGVVLVAAGDEIPVPGRGDRTYPFRAHSEYLYLTDRERPGGVLAFDPGEGWIEFVAPVTAEELLWTGLEQDREGVPEGTRPLDELEAFLRGRPVRRLGVTPEPDTELRDALIRVRRPKDEVEVERMRVAAKATQAGFAELVALIEPGRSERELQVALEAAFLRNGGDFLAFETIVAAGDHAAVLHFSPNGARAARRRTASRRRGRRVSRLRQRRHPNVRGRRRLYARAGARLRDRATGRRGRDRRVPARTSSGETSTVSQRSSSRTASSSWAFCVATASRSSTAAP